MFSLIGKRDNIGYYVIFDSDVGCITIDFRGIDPDIDMKIVGVDDV